MEVLLSWVFAGRLALFILKELGKLDDPKEEFVTVKLVGFVDVGKVEGFWSMQ
jgi:hypothetical protein